MTSIGLEIPPDQNASQMRSILVLRSPVITRGRLRDRGWLVRQPADRKEQSLDLRRIPGHVSEVQRRVLPPPARPRLRDLRRQAGDAFEEECRLRYPVEPDLVHDVPQVEDHVRPRRLSLVVGVEAPHSGGPTPQQVPTSDAGRRPLAPREPDTAVARKSTTGAQQW